MDANRLHDVTGSYGRTLVIWTWLDRMDAPWSHGCDQAWMQFFLRMDIVEETK